MSFIPKSPVEKFSKIKTDHLIHTGPQYDYFRVRDLDDDVWALARFYVESIDPSKQQQIQRAAEKCNSVSNDCVLPVQKIFIEDDILAVVWSYREGISLAERLCKEFGPRKIVQFVQAVVQAVIDQQEQGVPSEYVTFHDVLVDLEDRPVLTAGAFSKFLSGASSINKTDADVEREALIRLGSLLLSISFGRHNDQLIKAVQMETDVPELISRYRDLLDIDPWLIAIIAKCLMPIDSKAYISLEEMKFDLDEYLKGRAVTVPGIDFHQIIQDWRASKKKQDS